MIERMLTNKIKVIKGKVTIILGARQVGKTTLINELFANKTNIKWFNGDEPDTNAILKNITSTRFATLLGKNTEILIFDEAQRIENIGLKLKLLTDNFKSLKIIATGSSAFELKNQIFESLAGRKYEYKLFPLSFKELSDHFGVIEEKRLLENRLIFGSYPEVINNPSNEIEILKNLVDSVLYKDILMLDGIKSSANLIKLLKALAYQIGSQVSYNELGNLYGINYKTVERYIDVLEKSFIVFQLNSYSKNKRNELKKSKKVYFYDTGIRNALISEFKISTERMDIGALFENYIISEKMKLNYLNPQMPLVGFWKNKMGAEIDLIEEMNGSINCFEIKYNPNKSQKIPDAFKTNYDRYNYQIVNSDNYADYLN
jgi:predicted AAA+ superfamily ATPase